jgi:hypothetical protein
MSEQLVGWPLMAEAAELDDDDFVAAGLLLAKLKVNVKATAALQPIVAHAIGMNRRAKVRNIERRAPRKGLGKTFDSVQARKEMAEAFFALGDGTEVRWGEATVEQHRQRIDMLVKMQSGLGVTIARHESAIAEIEAAGVSCLDEVEGEAA